MSQKTKKVGNQSRSASRDRAVSCEKCKMAFAVPKNSPVDYVPAHKCIETEKHDNKTKEADLTVVLRDLQSIQFTAGLIATKETIEAILGLYKKVKCEMGSLVVLNIVVAVYVLFMVFLVVNYPYFV